MPDPGRHALHHWWSTALVVVALGDLFKRNSEIPWAILMSMDPPEKLVGAWLLDTLAEDMATKNVFHVPNIFGRARTILTEAGRDVKECFIAGVIQLGLHYFPAVKFCDARGLTHL